MDIIDYEEDSRKKVEFIDADRQWYGNEDDRPEIERLLQSLQDAYYEAETEAKRRKIWSEMFLHLQKYTRSLLLKRLKNNKFISPEDVEDKATQATLALMSQYVYRKGFHCGASFAGMVSKRILEALYKFNNDDHTSSLNMMIGDSDTEMESAVKALNIRPLYQTETETEEPMFLSPKVTEVFSRVIDEFLETKPDEKVALKVLMYLLILLRRPKNKHCKPKFLKYSCDKTELDMINLVEMEIYKRAKEAIGG